MSYFLYNSIVALPFASVVKYLPVLGKPGPVTLYWAPANTSWVSAFSLVNTKVYFGIASFLTLTVKTGASWLSESLIVNNALAFYLVG